MHIITPYDPWSPKKKKKTWQEELWEQQEIAEIEARLLAEAQRQQNANQAETVDQTQAHTVGDAASVASSGIGAAIGAAGAGGVPVQEFFKPSLGASSITLTKASPSAAPVTLAAGVGASRYATVEWNVYATSSAYRVASYLSTDYPTTLTMTGSYRISSTASYGGTTNYAVTTFSASKPELQIGFNQYPDTGPVPLTVTLTNTSIITSTDATGLTYNWSISGSSTVGAIAPITRSTDVSPTFTLYVPGTYVVTLSATSSYFSDIKTITSSINTISASIA